MTKGEAPSQDQICPAEKSSRFALGDGGRNQVCAKLNQVRGDLD
jgi:hypothetical protein